MTKLEEMKVALSGLISTMQTNIDADKLDEAEKNKSEIEALRSKMSNQAYLDKLNAPEPALVSASKNAGEKESANFIRACIKKLSGKELTEVENALLLPSTTNPNGANGESYILPQDIQTKINKQIRDFRSFRDVCGRIGTTALTGSFTVENIDSLAGLVDFTDGTDGTDVTDFSFTQIKFSLKEKAAFIKLSNTLLALTDNDLIAYIAEVFAKKAVITENAMAVAAIESGKTKKTLSGWQALKSSINKDLDPAALYNTVIVTNQDGYDALDSALDTNGRPILQPDVTNPTEKRFMGYPVKVFSNAQLPTVDDYAPVYYGNLSEGVKFVDLGTTQFATSSEAGFYSNTTVARLIEFVEVVQCDASDKCYIAAQLKVSADAGD